MLTDTQIRKAKPADKAYKLADSGGLHLVVTSAGSKLWRLKYRFTGREKLLSIGPYPTVSLALAREQRDRAKAILADGRDPAEVRRDQEAARARAASQPETTFEAVARAWHALNTCRWKPHHAADVLESLVQEIFPTLGGRQIATIKPKEVLDVLRPIEARGAIDTARRIRQRISAVFVHAIAESLCEQDPAIVVRPAMAPLINGLRPALIDLPEVRGILRAVEAIPASPITTLAMRFLALTAMRPGEVRAAAWSEFEGLDEAEPLWRIPAERMKMKREHLVPLSHQAVETLNALRPLTGRCPLVFPNAWCAHKPMSENAMGYLLNRAGFHGKHVPHGWRSSFSTVMNERFRGDREVIDLMLAHQPTDKVEAAYNRSLHMGRRRELGQLWADLLMQDMQPPSALVDLPRRASTLPCSAPWRAACTPQAHDIRGMCPRSAASRQPQRLPCQNPKSGKTRLGKPRPTITPPEVL